MRRLLVAALLFTTACARCGGGGVKNRNAEEFIDPSTSIVVSVPSLANLADRSQALLKTARAGAGGDVIVKMAATLAIQLGFDPLTQDGQKKAGLDPTRSMAVGATGRRSAYVALPYSDLSILDATVARLAKDRAGAGTKESRKIGETDVTIFAASAGGRPELAYATKDGFMLLAAGEGAAESAAAAATRTAEQSIAKSPLFSASKAKIGERELYVFLPKSAAPKVAMMPDVLTVGIGISGNELAVRAYLALPPDVRDLWAKALVGGGEAELAKLPKAAPAYLRGGVDLAAITKEAATNPQAAAALQRARELATEAGIDLDAELIANIEPGFAVTFGIAPTANLANAFEFDPRRSNPFESYTILGIGKVKDAAKAAATMEKLGKLVERFGTTVTSKDVGGAKVWVASYRLGEGLSWTLKGNELVVAGGYAANLEGALKQLADKSAAVTPAEFAPRAKDALFSKAGVAFAIDFGRIAQEVEKLPPEAFGTGPGAFMARSVATGVIQPMSRLKAVLAVAPVEGGLTIDLSAAAQ